MKRASRSWCSQGTTSATSARWSTRCGSSRMPTKSPGCARRSTSRRRDTSPPCRRRGPACGSTRSKPRWRPVSAATAPTASAIRRSWAAAPTAPRCTTTSTGARRVAATWSSWTRGRNGDSTRPTAPAPFPSTGSSPRARRRSTIWCWPRNRRRSIPHVPAPRSRNSTGSRANTCAPTRARCAASGLATGILFTAWGIGSGWTCTTWGTTARPSSRGWCSRSSPGSTCRRSPSGYGSKTMCSSRRRAQSGSPPRRRRPRPRSSASCLVLLALDVFEELLGFLPVFVVQHVADRQGLDRGELLTRLGVMPEIDVHFAEVEPVKNVVRLQRDGLRKVLLRVVPVALVEKAASEERFGEELLEPRQPFDLGMPGADQVTRAVVGRVELDRLHAFIIDDLGEAHPLLAALGARQPAQGLPDGEMAVGSVGVHAHRGLAEGARRGVETVPQMLGRVVFAFDLLGDVHELPARLPQRLVVEGVEREGRAVVPQGLLRRERRVGAVAQRDVLRQRGPRLAGEQGGTGDTHEQQRRDTAHQRLRTGAGR